MIDNCHCNLNQSIIECPNYIVISIHAMKMNSRSVQQQKDLRKKLVFDVHIMVSHHKTSIQKLAMIDRCSLSIASKQITIIAILVPNLGPHHMIELTFRANRGIINQISDRDLNILKALSNVFTNQPLNKRKKKKL